MTQHSLPQDMDEDRDTMRRIAAVIGCFFVATAAMAITIGITMG